MNNITLTSKLPRLTCRGLALPMLLTLLLSPLLIHAQSYSGNPVLPGYKADPDVLIANSKYYIYPTSTSGNEFRVYSSTDLTSWTDEGVIFDLDTDCSWANDRPWAPTVVYRNNQYYFYYSASIKVGVAVSSSPTGPFTDIGQPLIGSDPYTVDIIDPDVFVDDDGKAYIYYGGSNGAKMVYRELNPDMVSFASGPQNITPPNYTEAPMLVKRDGTYYMMYSNGSWFNSSYNVRYSTSSSPTGPWTYRGQVLSTSGPYEGPGHHGILKMPGCDEYYIIYHRWEGNNGNRQRRTAIDRMYFNSDGNIRRVQMTNQGVLARNLSDACRPSNPSPSTSIISGSIYELEPQCAPGKRLDVAGARTANGTNIHLWQQNGNSAQAWKVMDQGNGYYELEPQCALGKRLDVAYAASTNGTNVQIHQDLSNSAQRWKIMDQGNGYYELEPQCAPGKRLDVAGASSSNGTNVHLWQDYSNSAQRWKFILKSSNARTVSEKTKKLVEEASIEQPQVYPNPAKSQLQIALPHGALPTQLYIHDLLGRLWLEKVLPESQSVDVSRLPVGVYTVRLQQGAQIQTQKLVIE